MKAPVQCQEAFQVSSDIPSFESCVKNSGPGNVGEFIQNMLKSTGTEESSLYVF